MNIENYIITNKISNRHKESITMESFSGISIWFGNRVSDGDEYVKECNIMGSHNKVRARDIIHFIKKYIIETYYADDNNLLVNPLHLLIDEVGINEIIKTIRMMQYYMADTSRYIKFNRFTYKRETISNETAIKYLYGYSKKHETNYLDDEKKQVSEVQLLANISNKLDIMADFIDMNNKSTSELVKLLKNKPNNEQHEAKEQN